MMREHVSRASDSIEAAIARVDPVDRECAERALERQKTLTAPEGSLGRLLEIGRTLAAIQRTDRPRGEPAVIAVCAADHGVAVEGVSKYPPQVTGQMVANYRSGGAAVNVLARRFQATVRVIDLGVKYPCESECDSSETLLIRAPIAAGTRNFLEGAAMSREEAYRAVETGIELADSWARSEGFEVFALGEMGIGNTTSASALAASLTGARVADVVGRGTGIDDSGLIHKREIVARALALHAAKSDVWDRIAALGGFEILGLAGLAIGAAAARRLVVLDGFISSVAGLIAARLCPNIQGYLLAAHRGPEPGHRVVLEKLGLVPLLELDLRLGEGTGAAIALPIVAAAADLLRDMATFDSAGVSGPTDPVR
jgi:nicotinate-nucleotide--dimethylbenzimidazole phosphoribosyltransferase